MKYKIELDGNCFCAFNEENFINAQESNVTFGDNPVEALQKLIDLELKQEKERCWSIRKWKCNNCGLLFERGRIPHNFTASCPHCKVGSQYTIELR